MTEPFRQTVAILIPCHNEEQSIRACLHSCLDQTRPADQVIVVNDGSTDATASILAEFGDRIEVVTLASASGTKSRAQEHGYTRVRTDIVITTDADSLLDSRFIERILPCFDDPSVAAASGYVRSIQHNWLTALREIDYLIGQTIHKVAQAYVGALFVLPGCASALRMSVLRTIPFTHDTITEDLDLTYTLHTRGYAISYCPGAVVYTQDPASISVYMRQMRRWHAGGWQNLLKHYRALLRPSSALQLSLIYIEGLAAALMLAWALIVSPGVALAVVALQAGFAVLAAVYGAYSLKRYDIIAYAPLYPLLLLLNAAVFLEQFVAIVILRRTTHAWIIPTRRALEARPFSL